MHRRRALRPVHADGPQGTGLAHAVHFQARAHVDRPATPVHAGPRPASKSIHAGQSAAPVHADHRQAPKPVHAGPSAPVHADRPAPKRVHAAPRVAPTLIHAAVPPAPVHADRYAPLVSMAARSLGRMGRPQQQVSAPRARASRRRLRRARGRIGRPWRGLDRRLSRLAGWQCHRAATRRRLDLGQILGDAFEVFGQVRRSPW